MGFSDKLLSMIGLERKAAKDPPDYGYNQWFNNYQNYWSWVRSRRPTDSLKLDLGDLDCNSLVMAVVNYSGIRLPEAKPAVYVNDEAVPNHPLSKVIRRPNRHFIWANYALALSLSWWIDGNVYFLKERSIASVENLWYLPHFLVRARWPNDGGSPAVPESPDNDPVLSHYQYNVPGKAPVLYPATDILHIKRGVNLANVRSGLSAFEPLIKELYGDDKMALFTASIMKNMGIQVPVFTPKDDQSLDATQAAAMREQWMTKTTGDEAGSPVFMTIPLDVAKFGFSPTELDLSALRQVPESRVAAVTGIPAATLQFLVGLKNGTSYASSQQARQQGYEEVVIPMQAAIAEEINWQLLPDFDSSSNAEFRFDTSQVRVLQEDQDALMKRATVGYLGGVIKRGEARKMVGQETTPDDDVFFEPRGSGVIKEGEDPLAGAVANPAKFLDMDRYMNGLEKQMDDFYGSVERKG